MNAQDRAAIEQMLEMLQDNREYIEANERDSYLEMYDKAIADGEALLKRLEQAGPTYSIEKVNKAYEVGYTAGIVDGQRKQPDYAWPTVQDYEKSVGCEVNDTFKTAWALSRMTNDLFEQLGGSEE